VSSSGDSPVFCSDGTTTQSQRHVLTALRTPYDASSERPVTQTCLGNDSLTGNKTV